MSAATRLRLARMLAQGPVDLAAANLLICAEALDGVDADAALAHVEGLARLARDAPVADVLREQGFGGAREDYDDPRNSLLSEVLERRRGLPIALSTLALAVARRAGAPMAGIGMPGHFVVADLAGPEPVYVDPFGGWRPIDAAACAEIVARTTGLAFRPEFLAPVSDRAILSRTLLNLRGSYLRRGRIDAALWTAELGLIVTPGDVRLVTETVTLLTAAGRYEEAEAAASPLLDAEPGHPLAPTLRERLRAAADLRRRMN